MKTSSSSETSSTDDDVPIKTITKKYEISSAMEALLRYETEKCEFCSKICYNQYDVFVHNASHITVRLNHGIPTCKHCKIFFTTNAKLNTHNQTHHNQVPDILKDIIKSKPIVKMDKSVTDVILEKNKLDVKDVQCTLVSALTESSETLTEFVSHQPVIQCEDTINKLIIGDKKCDKIDLAYSNETSETLTGFVSSQPVVQCEDTITKLIIGDKKCDKVDLGYSNDVEIIDCDEYDCQNDEKSKHSIQEEVTKESIVRYGSCFNKVIIGDVIKKNKHTNGKNNKINETAKLKSKILFEDDGIEDDIINLNEICDLTQSDSDNDKNEEFKHNKIVLGSKISKETGPIDAVHRKISIVEGNFSPSIHYDQLMKYGVFCCAHCEKAFPNRLQKINHEATHLKLNPRPNSLYRKIRICQFCDQYIVGNHFTLKRHVTNEHAGMDAKMNYNWRICDKCSLRYYSYWRHVKKYHLIYKCELCSKPFEKESALREHKKNCRGFKYYEDEFIKRDRCVKVCQMCYLFEYHKRNKDIQTSDYSEPGKRVRCQRCDKEFFELKLLKYVVGRHVDTFCPKKKTPMTNEVRLKKFQNRLKSMKKLAR